MRPRDRRALIWGAIAIAGATLLLRGVPWASRGLDRLRQRAVAQYQAAERAHALLAQRAASLDSLNHVLTTVVALAPRLVEGRSAAEAGASLSSVVSLAASRHALKVVRLDPLPDSGAGAFQRAAVHAELEGDVAGVAALLKAVETSVPLLSVESLAISAVDPFSPRTAPELLHIEMDVAGFYLPRGAK